MKAKINRIIPFSNVDGPSNRMAIFFQKCNFNCLFCHNPETINECINCGICVDNCPTKALYFDDNNIVKWNKELCCSCDTCLKVCPNSSCAKIEELSVEDILEKIKEVRPYIKGITTSGGECTLQKEFLIELFNEVKKMDLTCFVDSNGSTDFQKEVELTNSLDKVMLDVKAFNNDFHKILCKKDNEMVIKNLKYLLEIDKLYEVRTIIFPNKDKENYETIKAVSEIIKDKCDYKIIRYRPFGVKEENKEFLSYDETSKQEALKYVDLARSLGATKAYLV